MQNLMPPIGTPDNLFHDGNPLTGEQGTIVTAAHLNNVQGATRDIQTELLAVLADAKIEVNPEDHAQLLKALKEVIGTFGATKFLSTSKNLKEIADAGDDAKAEAIKNLGLKDILDELKKNTGRPVLYRDWTSLRTAIPVGQAPADGQIIENGRALYPDAWAAIQAGLVPVCSEAEWLANPSKRGCYTTGDGRTNFRVPDYNGKSDGALGAVVFRGDGKNAAPAGDVQGDATRKITGSHMHCRIDAVDSTEGAFSRSDDLLWRGWVTQPVETVPARVINFDSSRVVPTAPENRMVNVSGVWTIHLFGAVLNAGSVDAAAMATAIAGLAARVSTLESAVNARKSTCLVNAAGTGAPHETVTAEMPARISTNTRLVLQNPFGKNTPVNVTAEVFLNNKWGTTGYVYSAPAGYGVTGGYVQGEGIIVQTGSYLSAVGSTYNGGTHGYSGENVTTQLPLRVFVSKI